MTNPNFDLAANLAPKKDRRTVIKAASGVALATSLVTPSLAFARNNPPRNGSVSNFKTLRSYPEAPNVAFQDSNGRDRFTKEFKGKPVLITFWSDRCHVCQYEMPTLDGIYNRATRLGYKVLPITIDRSNAVSRARRFYKRKGISQLPVYSDENRLMFAFYNGYATPMSFIVDRNGHVAGGIAGQASWDSNEAWDLLSYYA